MNWPEFLFLEALAFFAMVGLMTLVWIIHILIKRADIVDIAWAFGLALIGILFVYVGTGYPLRKYLIGGMVAIWGIRLGFHLLIRIAGHQEDGRYQQMRRDGKGAPQFFWFFQFQALLNVVLAIPFALSCINPLATITLIEWLGIGLWIIALCGESLADFQLKQFKAIPSNSGRVCSVGLWNYSRHPNYFFEWLIWVSFFLFALGSPFGLLAIAGPLVMLFFLFKVTGIPATEEQSLRSKGDAYRDYQKATSAFAPWFKLQ